MAWNFRRRLKIIPGVYLNFSKGGVSTSIGVRGASLTFGQKGTYFNTGIPGTGIYNRQKISGGSSIQPPVLPPQEVPGITPADNIFSAEVQEITSQDMQGVKEAIIAAREQRNELKKDLEKIKFSRTLSNLKLILSYILLVGLFSKSLAQSIKTDIASKQDAIRQLEEQISNCFVKLDVGFDAEFRVLYEKVVQTFKALTHSQRIWDVTGAYSNDRVTTRSAASTSIKTTEVRFGIKTLEDIKSEFEPLWMKNANGADLYFYPGFVVMHSAKAKFGLVGLAELGFQHSAVRYVETKTVPSDTKVIDRTWARVNKNGSPDRRFKDNYEIPVVKYGGLLLMTSTGLHEEYMFSNYESSEEFSKAFMDYQKVIKSLKPIAVS